MLLIGIFQVYGRVNVGTHHLTTFAFQRGNRVRVIFGSLHVLIDLKHELAWVLDPGRR